MKDNECSLELPRLLVQGESVNLEFKRLGGNVGADTFETICSFANSYGGTILLGVTDDGEAVGVGTKDLLSIK